MSLNLDHLRMLTDGWYEGSGVAPPHALLDWLEGVWRSPELAMFPAAFHPTKDGGIMFRWHLIPRVDSLEVFIDRTARWDSINEKNYARNRKAINLDLPDDRKWLVRTLKRHAAV